MRDDRIKQIFDQVWKPGYGSVSCGELSFIQTLIQRNRPRRFIEIGMASGLSGGFIASFMAENGGEYFTSLDHDNTFFGDTSKTNGFLMEEICAGGTIAIEKRPFRTSIDLPDLFPGTFDQAFDMAFVDANHAHPWPIIDTLCLCPFMRGSRIVIHHDLNLFRKQDAVVGIGPKYLHDQFPADRRINHPASSNIFAVSLDMPLHVFEDVVINALSLPWSLRSPLPVIFLEKFLSFVERFYGKALLGGAEAAAKKFNVKK